MRTNLPDTFAELTIVSTDGEELIERKESFLVSEMSTGGMLLINMTGATIHMSLYGDYVDDIPRIAGMTILSSEEDRYAEFVKGIQFADMTKSLESLGSYIEKEFKKIVGEYPTDNKTLWDDLKIHVDMG